MANKRCRKSPHLLATLVTENKAPCAFCQRKVDDEVTYGKLYAIGDIQCHYFCVLLSCCLIQKGKDEEGLLGFLYPDILTEIERSKKHRCSYCSKGGATLGCSVSQCRKQFHLPCGRERDAVSLFCGNYKSYCRKHGPKQNIPDHIMAAVRIRKKAISTKRLKAPRNLSGLKELCESPAKDAPSEDTESVCVICYESVEGFPAPQTFWPPCCARDAWFHRSCLQRMALSAGMHYLKCPLCNDKDSFYKAVVSQGYYVPDRDAAWELEQNAFAGIYERPLSCAAEHCRCPEGRAHDADTGMWDIKLCLLCGTTGVHAHCLASTGAPARYVCATCRPAAPDDMDALAGKIEAVILTEQAQSSTGRRGPVMPSRMSLRRTKQRIAYNTPSTSQNSSTFEIEDGSQVSESTIVSRLDLNLKAPRRPLKSKKSETINPTILSDIDNRIMSPTKLVEKSLSEKIRSMGGKEIDVLTKDVLERVREKFKKPRPLSAKKKIVNYILEGHFDHLLKDAPKTKEPIKEWISPKKTRDVGIEQQESTQENIDPKETTDKIRINSTPKKPHGPPEIIEEDTHDYKQSRIDDSITESVKKSLETAIEMSKDVGIDESVITCEDFKDLKDSQQGALEDTVNNSRDDSKKSTEDSISIIEDCQGIEPSNKLQKSSLEECNYKYQHQKIIPKIETPDQEVSEEGILENVKEETKLEADDCEELEDIGKDDESSRSTFQLPPEFIADHSNDSLCDIHNGLELCETPKKLKTVDIEKDSSLEISGNDQEVNINVFKIENNDSAQLIKGLKLKSPVKAQKVAFKFSPIDKETLQENNVDINVESFKNQYLNEVQRDFTCAFGHKHKHDIDKASGSAKILQTAIDFALNACKKEKDEIFENNDANLKRKLDIEDHVSKKKGRSNLKSEKKSVRNTKLDNSNKKLRSEGKSVKRKSRDNVSENNKNRTRDAISDHNKNINSAEKDKIMTKNNRKVARKMSDKKTRVQISENSTIRAVNDEKNVMLDNEVKKLNRKDAVSDKKQRVQSKDQAEIKKTKNCVLKYKKTDSNIRVVCSKKENTKKRTKTIDFTLNENLKKHRKRSKNIRENIQVKIKWKKEQLRLKITKSQSKKSKKQTALKQYILKYSPEASNSLIVKPESDVTPLKRKPLKQETTPDNLKQTSIQSFFKVM